MIEFLRNSEFANKFKHEIYPFKYSMRYIPECKICSDGSIVELTRNKCSKLQLKYTCDISEGLVAIVDCSYKDDKLCRLIIRSVEPEVVKLFIELYSVKDYYYTFVYNSYAENSYYTDIVKAYECGNKRHPVPKNTNSIKLLEHNMLELENEGMLTNIHHSIINIPYNHETYWKDKIDNLLGLESVCMVIISQFIHEDCPLEDGHFTGWCGSRNYVIHTREYKLEVPNWGEVECHVVLFLEKLNRKTSTKSARKIN